MENSNCRRECCQFSAPDTLTFSFIVWITWEIERHRTIIFFDQVYYLVIKLITHCALLLNVFMSITSLYFHSIPVEQAALLSSASFLSFLPSPPLFVFSYMRQLRSLTVHHGTESLDFWFVVIFTPVWIEQLQDRFVLFLALLPWYFCVSPLGFLFHSEKVKLWFGVLIYSNCPLTLTMATGESSWPSAPSPIWKRQLVGMLLESHNSTYSKSLNSVKN